MADITVSAAGTDAYEVSVTQGGSSTTHHVTVDPDDLKGLSGDPSPADLVAASFRFPLEREPKESILRDFELSVISRYFPEYREEIHSYL
jgi:hypothetical protein